MKKNEVSYYSHSNHDVYLHDNHVVIICHPPVDEIFEITSNKGSINLYCPGCGTSLHEEEVKNDI